MLEMTPEEAYRYAESQGCRQPKLEAIIAMDSEYSSKYASHVLRGRFELGEASIAACPLYSGI